MPQKSLLHIKRHKKLFTFIKDVIYLLRLRNFFME